MKIPTTSSLVSLSKTGVLTLALLTASKAATHAANISWIGGTDSYTNVAAWSPGAVPGVNDSAINNNGSNNAVQINVGDPDWTVNQIQAGSGAATSGAFVQNGQTITLNGTNVSSSAFHTPFRLGVTAGSTGVYTMNGGIVNYGSGSLNVGELGTGILNLNGGTITGSGNLAANLGVLGVPTAVTATVGGGLSDGDYTWFEQGLYTANLAFGLPTAGSTFASSSQPNHTFTMASSYTANDAVMISSEVPSATITPTSPAAASGLSFMGSAGNGTTIVNYTLHFADSSTESGTLTIYDWFPPGNIGSSTNVLTVGGRVDALGLNFQTPAGFPQILSQDVVVTNSGSAINSIDLTYVSGGIACLLAVSSSSDNVTYTPVAITGYNQDMIVGVSEGGYVANTVTNIVNHTGGFINVTGGGQLFIGNYGNSIYNLSGGSVDVHNYIAIGRSSGNGTLNMTGGNFNQDGGGNLLVGTGYNNNGNPAFGVLNQSGGTINSQGAFQCPENAPSFGTYNLSGAGVLNVQNEIVIGRGGGAGVMNMTGGTVTKTGGGNFIVGVDNSTVGTLNQTGGSIDVNNETWIGQSGGAQGLYNMSGGSFIARSWFVVGRGSSVGVLNLTNGSITKLNSGNNFIVADNATGTLNQYGGTITNTASGTWIGNGGGTGVWNMNGGANLLGVVNIINNSGSHGTLNLNGGVMALQELTTGYPAAVSQLTLNGGTLRATADNANFIHDIAIVNVSAGGAIIDSQNYNLTIPQALPNNGGDGSGGLTKNGTGTLTLTGANSYSGPTVVNAGKLVINTAGATGGGDYTVADGAELSLTVQSANAQLNAANLTLATSAAATLDIDLGAFGNPSSAPVNVINALTVNGPISVNIADAMPQFGQFALIKYGSKTGAGSFTVGSVPIGVGAYISNNIANLSIDLVITNVNLPRWEGLAGGNWDIGLTTNWINIGNGSPTFFLQNNAVVLNDSALGTTTLNLTANVNPSSVTVNNNTLAYTVVGTGKIGGNIGLTKQGANSLALLNTGGSDFTGPVNISGGTVIVTNLANGGSPSPIGASSANPTNLVLAGGGLSYAGSPVAVNRGYSVQTGGGTITTVSNLTLSGVVVASAGSSFAKAGSAQLAYTGVGTNTLTGTGAGGYTVKAGTVRFDGSNGAQTNIVQGILGLGNIAGVDTALVLTNASLTVSSKLEVGNSNNAAATLTVNNGSYLNVQGNPFAVPDSGGLGACTGAVVQAGGTVNSAAELWIGQGANAVGTYTLNGGTLNLHNWLALGRSASIGTFTMTGGTFNHDGGGNFLVGTGNGSTGTFNQSGGTVNTVKPMQIPENGNAATLGTYNLSGTGVVNASEVLTVGRSGGRGVFNMTGGTLNKTGSGLHVRIGTGGGSVGTFNQSGGTFTLGSGVEYWVAENGGCIGTNNISGTAVVNCPTYVTIGRAGFGVVNMSGGTFTQTGGNPFFIGIFGGGVGVWNHSGGTLSVGAVMRMGDGSTGTLNVSGGAVTVLNDVWIGQGSTGTGTVTVASSGVFTNTGWLAIGREDGKGVLNINGGTMVKTGGGNISIAHGIGDQTIVPSGIVNQNGGTFICASGETWISEDSGPGTWNMNGGSSTHNMVRLGYVNASAAGTLNLNAGVFAASEITKGSGSGTLNFNGGTLAATGNNTNFLHDLTAANVQTFGATIDSGANTISIPQPLLNNGGGGGLTKVGNGTLYLNGVNTYLGSTLVSTGALGGKGTIAGLVKVAAGAKLAPGTASIGTLTVNSLVLSNSSTTLMKISLDGGATNDVVTGLTSVTYGGSLVVTNVGATSLAGGGSFQLFNASSPTGNFSSVTVLPAGSGTFNPLTGVLTIASTAPPTVNSPKVSGGNLILTGTGGAPGAGYTWLTTTNLTNPVATWTTNLQDVFDGTGSFSNSIPINVANPAQFFRLRTP